MNMEMPPSNREGEKNKKLEILANKIMNRLRLERKLAGDNIDEKIFMKVSAEIFQEEGIPEEDYHNLRSGIGTILNQRKPRLTITKQEREKMVRGAKKLEKENKKIGITPEGDSDTEIMEVK